MSDEEGAAMEMKARVGLFPSPVLRYLHGAALLGVVLAAFSSSLQLTWCPSHSAVEMSFNARYAVLSAHRCASAEDHARHVHGWSHCDTCDLLPLMSETIAPVSPRVHLVSWQALPPQAPVRVPSGRGGPPACWSFADPPPAGPLDAWCTVRLLI
jgi:hypothetical protein